jgi:2-polyprenyl-3-methyl-5-hydroxy-6-metoxy-1,4-benzoquinol methylase
MSESDLYSNYIRREPHDRSKRFISNWHKKLLKHALCDSENPVRSVMEVGPGHGYFATHVVDMGMDYEFIDTSPAVHTKMKERGFDGHLGTVGDFAVSLKKFDLIWLSHVLEHSPTWVDARQLVSDVAGLLSPTGRIVIIGPDAQCWGREFWNIDATHGFPTTLRNVAQLADDVGLSVVQARHHRNANFNIVSKAIFFLLSVLPHRLIDRILTPERSKIGDGFLISWKAVFGWRQIFIVLSGRNLNK